MSDLSPERKWRLRADAWLGKNRHELRAEIMRAHRELDEARAYCKQLRQTIKWTAAHPGWLEW